MIVTKILRIPAFILLAGILFSCVNDMDTIQKVTFDPNAPDEASRNLVVFYNDSGYAKVEIHAALAETYRTPEHITKLKDGLKVNFFSEEGKITSSLTALYGEINYSSGIIMAKDSVVLRNFKTKKQLETEELFWNQNEDVVYTDKNVIIRQEGKGVIGRGKGLRTTQSFSKYVIKNPVGKINLDEE